MQSAGTALADVSVDLVLPTTTAHPGDRVPFTLTVVNHGPSTARNVSFRTVVPPGVTIERDPSPFCTPTACTLPYLGPYDPGATYPANATALDRGAVRITGTAVLAADMQAGAARAAPPWSPPPPTPWQPTTAASSTSPSCSPGPLRRPAGHRPRRRRPGRAGAAGGRVRQRLVVTNAGPTRAEGLVLRSAVPAGQPVPTPTTGSGACTFEGRTGAGGTAPDGGTTVCSLPALAAGATWEVLLDTALPASYAGTSFTRTARVAASSPDPDAAGDAAPASMASLSLGSRSSLHASVNGMSAPWHDPLDHQRQHRFPRQIQVRRGELGLPHHARSRVAAKKTPC